MSDYIWLSLAMNDDNGVDTPKLRALAIDDFDVHVACTGREVVVWRWRHAVKIGRHRYSTEAQQSWFGNMMWNGVLVGVDDAERILEYLRKSGNYDMEMGEEHIYDAWETGAPIYLRRHES